jgi:hypothetical protein
VYGPWTSSTNLTVVSSGETAIARSFASPAVAVSSSTAAMIVSRNAELNFDCC